MTEEQIGILIASLSFLLLFIPIIIGIIVVNVKERKYKKAFKSTPPQEKQEIHNQAEKKEQIENQKKTDTPEPIKAIQQNNVKETPPKQENNTAKNQLTDDDDDGWEEFYRTTIEPYYKKPYKATKQNQQVMQKGEQLPYRLKPSVMTNHEKIMYNLLYKYCQTNNLVLLSKVRIADFVEPIQQSYTREFYQWFNKISCKHIDFLICDPETIKPIVAIELDDYTHKYKSRKDRDIFIDNVYSSINLPIIHFWNVDELSIKVQLNNVLGIPNETKF